MDLFDFVLDDSQDKTIVTDNFKDERPLTVSELSSIVKTMVEGVGKVVVKGEISNLSKPNSGHIYFKIKDRSNIVNAVIWKSAISKLKFQPENGAEVVITGKLSTFSAKSEYQINVSQINYDGVGGLLKEYEQRKEKFSKLGFFDECHKKSINKTPVTIGIVTSETGDVFHDILHIIKQRFPCKIELYPVKVQGEGSAEEVANAIKYFNKQKNVETIIVARGGGSIEDLWAFNEEIVVNAVFNSVIPVISAIGHEPDYTLIDYVADLRAPTPTAAAEFATEDKSHLIGRLNYLKGLLVNTINAKIQDNQYRIDKAKYSLINYSKFVLQMQDKLKFLNENLVSSMGLFLKSHKQKLIDYERLLGSISPLNVLKRGYAYIQDENGSVIKSSKTNTNNVTINFVDGKRKAELKW